MGLRDSHPRELPTAPVLDLTRATRIRDPEPGSRGVRRVTSRAEKTQGFPADPEAACQTRSVILTRRRQRAGPPGSLLRRIPRAILPDAH